MAKTNSSVHSSAALVEWRLFRYRFVLLLAAVVLLLVAPPLLRASGLVVNPVAVRVVFVVLFSGTLLAGVFAVSRGHLMQFIAILLAVPAIILQGMNALLQRDGFLVPSHLFASVFLCYAVYRIMSYLFTADRTTANLICAAASVYMLLGLQWAILYSLLDILDPGSFVFVAAVGGEGGVVRFGGEHSLNSLYYSFTTMTTLGCESIAAVSPLARVFALLEAVVGQVVVVVLVARLVGLHVVAQASGSAR